MLNFSGHLVQYRVTKLYLTVLNSSPFLDSRAASDMRRRNRASEAKLMRADRGKLGFPSARSLIRLFFVRPLN